MYLLFVCFSHNRDERKRPLTNTISCLMSVLQSDAVTGTIQKSSGNAWFAELGCTSRKIESSKGGTHCQELTDLSWKSMLESPAWHDWLPSWQNIHRNVSHHCRWQPPGPVLCFSSKYFPLLLVLRTLEILPTTRYYVPITPTQSIIDQIAGPHLSQEES